MPTNSRTKDYTQPCYHGEKFDAFLSHSGQQKNFVRQLYKDLTNQGVSCFFDQDPQSLPRAEPFPPHIFEAAKTCQVAVLLLSQDFLESKWPMRELSAFVQARETTNPNLKIFPLFYNITTDALKKITADNEKWKNFEQSEEKRAEMQRALGVVLQFNGLPLREGDEVKFREDIEEAIWHLLPMPSPRYHVRDMQGEERICKEVATFFSNVTPNGKGIRIAGLYGIAGQGKTTLAKAFCNFKLGEFEGRVCHLEFCKADPIQNIKLALQYLTHRPDAYVQAINSIDQAKLQLESRVKQKRVLLVLDNITEDCIDEVLYYLESDLGEKSWVLLSAPSVDVLVKHFKINKQSCMRVPRLEEEEAITILMKRAFPGESNLTAQDRGFSLKCAKRCLFRDTSCDIGPPARSFHPLALKAFGGYLLSKYGSNLSKWVAEIDGTVGRPGDDLDVVFDLLDKAFDCMDHTYQTIFMLLAVYMPPDMSLHNVKKWLAIICNEEISFIEKSVEALVQMAFIEEVVSELRIHDLYLEFAQRKSNKMEGWLWWKEDEESSTRALIPRKNGEFEYAKFEQCRYRRVNPKYIRNLLLLQLVEVENMNMLDLSPMNSLRSITLRDCKSLTAVDGMEKMLDLQWLQITGVDRMFKLPKLSSLEELQYLHIDNAGSQVLSQLGDLTHCYHLRDIYVVCPSLIEFPRLKSMKHLEKVEFSLCDKVKGPLDCTDCVKLQTIVLSFCYQMTGSPLLAGCQKLSKVVMSECHSVTTCPDVDVPTSLKTLELQISSEAASAPRKLEFYSELENLQVWNMVELAELPSFQRLSNLTVLKLGKCGIREPPDLKGCERLENVYFYSLRNLKRFPNFSSLRELKKLSLCDCISVQDPPDIGGCHKLEVFHLLYNDNMEGVSKMDKCIQLEEIQVSWRSLGAVAYRGFDRDNFEESEELEWCLEYWKDEKFGSIGNVRMPIGLEEVQCVKGKTIMLKRYFRGERLFYSLTSPYVCFVSGIAIQTPITLTLMDIQCDDRDWFNQTASETARREWRDRKWFNKVRGYFAERGKTLDVRLRSDMPDLRMCQVRQPGVTTMQGEVRICKELADFIETSVRPDAKGVRIAGLYGVPGQGKSTVARALCINSSNWFEGGAFYVEFCEDETLQYLSHLPMPHIDSAMNEDPYYFFDTFMKGRQSVLLVIDNISDENIDQVKYYLGGTDMGENSCLLLCTGSLTLLTGGFKMDRRFCMQVPWLKNEEAIAILMERAVAVESELQAESRDCALKCANKYSFYEGRNIFHPLALKILGRHLFHKHSNHFSSWAAEMDVFAGGAGDGSNEVFAVLENVLERMEDKYRTIFIFLATRLPPNMPTGSAFELLSWSFNEEIAQIKKAVEDLYECAFIEEIEPEIRIHELLKKVARSRKFMIQLLIYTLEEDYSQGKKL